MQFSILGPLEVRADGHPVPLGGAQPRALLAVLLLHPNQPVSADHLALALWGEDAPAGAAKTVQVYVSRLRKALGERDVLATTPAGYRLRVRPGELDAERFEQRVAEGRRALASGEPEQAAAVLREALTLWRGPPLADLASSPFAAAEVARLEEQQLAAVELRVEADLALGRHAELVADLSRLTRRHPWRERLHGQLMLALYRTGRQADALQAYRQAREVLVEQLGIEPGAELHNLHQAILVHDPSLDPPRAAIGALADGRGTVPAPSGRLSDRGLPRLPNRTIGRGREVRALAERLLAGSVRLLTLTGPGGIGKTRLALEAALAVQSDFADGAHFVSLAALHRPEDVPAAIVTTLGIVVLSGESPEAAVRRSLAAKRVLLVADNCEHLPGAAPFIGGLLGECRALTVLATSREPLALQAEERYPVSPLGGTDAVALFTERARAHDPGFDMGERNAAAVAEICRRVDGLPLAIELAAARSALLSPTEIAARLDAALGTGGAGARDAPARHRSLRATIDWSHGLLLDDEKACFARFAVFAGGATVDAAEEITGADLDTLDRLVAKSLLVAQRQPHRPTRLLMLETIRAYAAERFAAAADQETVRERHYRYYLALAEQHGTERALCGTSRKTHLALLDAEIDNLDRALAWALGRPDAEPALALCAALAWYWPMRDRYADAVGWIDQALRLPRADVYPALRIRALSTKAWALWPLGRAPEQQAIMAEAESSARALADPLLLSQVLQTRVSQEATANRSDVARTLADEAMHHARAAGDDWAIAMAAFAQAMASYRAPELRERVDRAAALLDNVGNVFFLADMLASGAYAALCVGSDRDASDFVSRAVPMVRRLESPYLWMLVRGNLGLAALLTGDVDTAFRAFREELKLCRELVALPFSSEGLLGLAAIATVRGDLDRAARLVGAAAAHRHGYFEDPVDARLDAIFFQDARTSYGPDSWDAAARDGATWSFDDAIDYALQEPDGVREEGARL